MSVSPTPYTLTGRQLDAALAALEKASATFCLSPIEKLAYRAMGICVATVVVGFSVGILLLLSEVPGCYGIIGVVISFAIGILAGIAAMVLFVANFGLMLKTVRQRRLVKALGLREISYSAWRAHRRRGLFFRIFKMLWAALAVGLLIAASSVLFRDIRDSLKDLESMAVLGFLFLLFATPVVWLFVQRSREQLDVLADAGRLREILASMQTGSENGVVVPATVLESVARIEHAQIARERASAVVAGVTAVDRGYGVLFARDVSVQKALLPADSRLDVEELIDQLVVEPYPPGTHGEGVLSARTPDGLAEIDYSVDEPNRRIEVVALRTSSAVPGGTVHGL
jgi:hypothetical protein